MKKMLKQFGTATILMLSICGTKVAFAGERGGNGGDAAEIRVNEIRSDILGWIDRGGYLGLDLGGQASQDEYEQLMKKFLAPKYVGITFLEKDSSTDPELVVSVDSKPKTCKGYFAARDGKPQIICNISRFTDMNETDKYRLIHHEYAGLAGIEHNSGSESDYEISKQLSEYLEKMLVVKLAVRKVSIDKCSIMVEKDTEPATISVLEKLDYKPTYEPANLALNQRWSEGNSSMCLSEVISKRNSLGSYSVIMKHKKCASTANQMKFSEVPRKLYKRVQAKALKELLKFPVCK